MSSLSPALPIAEYRSQIITAVQNNQVTILTAETGAGKSTQLPQYLAEAGYERVIVTQPRILAARNLTRRVREEWHARSGDDAERVIGYRTAMERDDDPSNTILYCTDGLQLVRELTGIGVSTRQVLVLDEVREWNENMEVLVAWSKRRVQEDPQFKVVIMSATIESAALADYFHTSAVITVPGRSYPVVHRKGRDLITEVTKKIEAPESSNMLVFLPGKAGIEAAAEALEKVATAAHVPIIPLHAQLEASAQQAAFANYPHGKVILSTNIAQTSVTIDDIDVVIDSGLERRSEVRSGVEGLFIAQISQADCQQRAGRAGRTKPGEYILASFNQLECADFDDRPAYPVPAIMRSLIDRLTLRLASIDIDIETLDFYHDPSRRAIKLAKQTLVSLGALTPRHEITKIGRQMERFPVESSFGRMLVEGQRYDAAVLRKLAAMIAVLEVGGITRSGQLHTGWRAMTRQTRSDVLAQYEVFINAQALPSELLEELGIIEKNLTKAEETYQRLARELGFEATLGPLTQADIEPLLRSVVAGQLHSLWSIDRKGMAVNLRTRDQRELSNATVVRGARLVAGTPFDIEITNRFGNLETLHIVQNITEVDATWLRDMAPAQFQIRPGKVYFDSRKGRLARRQIVTAHGQAYEGREDDVPADRHDGRLAREYSAWLFDRLVQESRVLKRRGKRVPIIRLNDVQTEIEPLLRRVSSLDELDGSTRRYLKSLSSINAWRSVSHSADKRAAHGRDAVRIKNRVATIAVRHADKIGKHVENYVLVFY